MIINKKISEGITPEIPIGTLLLFVNMNGVWRVKNSAGLIYDLTLALGGVSLVTLTNAELKTIMDAGIASPSVTYRITNCPQGIVRVTGINTARVSHSAQLEGSSSVSATILQGGYGTYVVASNVFSPISGAGGGIVSIQEGAAITVDSTNNLNPIVRVAAAKVAEWDAKQGALGFTPENVANKATDFASPNNTTYPTTLATNTQIAAMLVGLLDLRGSYDASSNLFPSTGGSGVGGAILKGDFWIVSVIGTLGGVAVIVSQSIFANVDAPAQTLANWAIMPIGFITMPTFQQVTPAAVNVTTNGIQASFVNVYDGRPQASDDATLGFVANKSRWIDFNTQIEYLCTGTSQSAATWVVALESGTYTPVLGDNQSNPSVFTYTRHFNIVRVEGSLDLETSVQSNLNGMVPPIASNFINGRVDINAVISFDNGTGFELIKLESLNLGQQLVFTMPAIAGRAYVVLTYLVN